MSLASYQRLAAADAAYLDTLLHGAIMSPAASLQFTKVFVVRATDEDGRPRDIVGLASTEATADEMAKGRGGWGAKGDIREGVALLAPTGSAYLLENVRPFELNVDIPKQREERIQNALAKLTPAEQLLLGLTKT